MNWEIDVKMKGAISTNGYRGEINLGTVPNLLEFKAYQNREMSKIK